MALTIKQKVSFEVTVVVDSETEAAYIQNALEASRNVMKGEVGNAFDMYCLKVTTEKGVEAGVREFLAKNLKEQIKELMLEDLAYDKLSPVVVRNV